MISTKQLVNKNPTPPIDILIVLGRMNWEDNNEGTAPTLSPEDDDLLIHGYVTWARNEIGKSSPRRTGTAGAPGQPPQRRPPTLPTEAPFPAPPSPAPVLATARMPQPTAASPPSSREEVGATSKVSPLLHIPISAKTSSSGIAHDAPPSGKHSSTPLQQKVNIDRKHLSKGVRRTEEFNIHQSSGTKPEDNPSTQKQEEKQLARHNTRVPPAKPVKQSVRERHPGTPTHGKAQSFRSVFPRQLRRPDNKASSEIVRKHSNFINNSI